MKQQEVFKKIGGIIREINEQYDYLQSAEGVFNDLELELLIANSHFLTDHIEILRKIASYTEKSVVKEAVVEIQKPVIAPAPVAAPPAAEEKPAAEPRYFEPVLEQEEEPAIEEEEITELTAPTVEFEIGNRSVQQEDAVEEPEPEEESESAEEPAIIEPEPKTIRHELTLEDIGEDWDEDEDEIETLPEPAEAIEEVAPVPAPEPVKPAPQPVAVEPEPKPEAQPEIKPEPTPEPVVIAVTHTQIMVEEEQVLTLNQRMSAGMAASRMSDQLHAQPIADLKSAITLNDKLLYIRELFNGYSLAYSEAIDILNRAKNFEEAQKFLTGSYATKNNWADKQATADKFYALLQRRYL